MSVFNLAKGDGAVLPSHGAGKSVLLQKTIDFSELDSGNGAGAADVVRLWDIPANTIIEDVVATGLTAEGGAATIDVGDFLKATDAAVDADGYIDGADANAVGISRAKGGATAFADGKAYAANTAYIGVTAVAALDAAVIRFTARATPV